MKPRLKSSLLLLLTLIIGMVLGAILQSTLHDKRMKRTFMLRNEESFIEAVETAIQPTTEEQAKEIRLILEEAAPRIIAHIRNNRELVRAEFDQVKASLIPLLDEKQQANLEERLTPPRSAKRIKTPESGK